MALALAALPEGKRKRVLVEALQADDAMRAKVFAIVAYLGRPPEPTAFNPFALEDECDADD